MLDMYISFAFDANTRLVADIFTIVLFIVKIIIFDYIKYNAIMRLVQYILEKTDDKKTKPEKVEVESVFEHISIKRLKPSNIVNHSDQLPKDIQNWLTSNCEIEQFTMMDLAQYCPVSFDVNNDDIIKWISQNFDNLLGGNETPKEEPKEEPKGDKPAPKPEPKAAEPTQTVKESAEDNEPAKTKDMILDGTPPKSAIFCKDVDDGEYWTIIWCRLESTDKDVEKLRSIYKELDKKGEITNLTFAPYEQKNTTAVIDI